LLLSEGAAPRSPEDLPLLATSHAWSITKTPTLLDRRAGGGCPQGAYESTSTPPGEDPVLTPLALFDCRGWHLYQWHLRVSTTISGLFALPCIRSQAESILHRDKMRADQHAPRVGHVKGSA
jgi:hypothetical protein